MLSTTVGEVQVVGLCRKLGSERIDLLDNWKNASLLAQLSHL